MEIPEIKAPYAIIFRFKCQEKDMSKRVFSMLNDVSIRQTGFTSIMNLREGAEYALVIEATEPIDPEVAKDVRILLKVISFLVFVSEEEFSAKKEAYEFTKLLLFGFSKN